MGKNPNSRKSCTTLFFIFMMGLLFRMYSLSSADYQGDEALYAFAAKSLLESNISPFDSISWTPPMFTYLNAAVVHAIGFNKFSMRIVSSIFGSLTIMLLYFITKKWFNRKTALIASTLFAFSPLHIVYSRSVYIDVVQAFFVLLTIFLMEESCENKARSMFAAASGIVFGFSILLKANSIVIIGLYILFNLVYSILRKDKPEFVKYLKIAVISTIIAALFVIFFVAIMEGVKYIPQMIYGFFMMGIIQSTNVSNPFHYHFLVLFDALSPLVSIALPFALYFSLRKGRTRNENLVIAISSFYFIILLIQGRREARHHILFYPFVYILIGNYIYNILQQKKIKLTYIMIPLIVSSVLWSSYEISKTLQFDGWSQAASDINKNYPTKKIHVYWTHVKRIKLLVVNEVVYNDKINPGDIVILTMPANSSIIEDHPLSSRTFFYSRDIKEFPPDYIEFVKNNGKIVYEYKFKGRTAIWLYEITGRLTYPKFEEDETYGTENEKIGKLVNKSCKIWSHISLYSQIIKIFPTDIKNAVNLKCKG